MEIKTLSGRQLVSTLLAAAAHLHLPLPPLLLVALYGRLPSFVGMNNASVVVQFLICVTYESRTYTLTLRPYERALCEISTDPEWCLF